MRGAAGALLVLGLVQLGLAVASCTPSCCAREQELRDRVEQLERMLGQCEALARSSTARARACSR
ncbi:MAG TPA: hypothetical protein VFN67_37400 [Polyangiales bacterium]|nr:hypothetical protein [Polyangiales bacterium]